MNTKEHYKFLETLVDITWLAGAKHYHSGDSREDIGTMIAWAEEFEAANKDREWDGGENNDYMIEIEKFAFTKLEDSGHCHPKQAKVVVQIEGGVLQDYVSNVPLELYRFDWDNIKDCGHDHEGDGEPETDEGTEVRFQSAFDACKARAEEIKNSK